MVVAYGVDYAFPPRPRASVLKQQGKTFACRYGGKGTSDKMLDATELASLRGQGIDVVANVEGSAGGFRGYLAGQDWARKGLAWFNDLGMPAGRPLYFSADWDVSASSWPDLADALRGAASIVGRERVGLYGGRYAIAQAKGSGLARWFWQTYAWSGNPTVWVSGVHIQQYHNGVTIDGADCDLNRAMLADYGQWGYKGEEMDWNDKLYEKGDNTTDNAGRSVREVLQDVEKTDGVWRGAFGLDVAKISANSPMGKLIAALPNLPNLARIDDIETKLDQLSSAVNTLANAPVVQVTQDQINEAVFEAFKRVFGAGAV